MKNVKSNPNLVDLDSAIRERILERAKKYNSEILKRFSIAADDLENNKHRAALGALDGIDSILQEFRTLLRMAEEQVAARQPQQCNVTRRNHHDR
jgi:hypothetical protein